MGGPWSVACGKLCVCVSQGQSCSLRQGLE